MGTERPGKREGRGGRSFVQRLERTRKRVRPRTRGGPRRVRRDKRRRRQVERQETSKCSRRITNPGIRLRVGRLFTVRGCEIKQRGLRAFESAGTRGVRVAREKAKPGSFGFPANRAHRPDRGGDVGFTAVPRHRPGERYHSTHRERIRAGRDHTRAVPARAAHGVATRKAKVRSRRRVRRRDGGAGSVRAVFSSRRDGVERARA
mmetsp:Transcript_12399/g.46271  ORF Transcript_12399/g.46271 Transcript_12399/m.46271 type:complete len:205 (-) Transcript_12399:342-956(-)